MDEHQRRSRRYGLGRNLGSERSGLGILHRCAETRHYYLITGTCGKWNGPQACGNFITGWDDFRTFIRHLDTLKIYERNGHLYIEGYHHDGHDRYEFKRLTEKGVEYASSRHFAHDKALHEKIMNNNFFSALPRLADIVFGNLNETKSA